MEGEVNLKVLLQTMDPQLNEGEYIFCSLSDEIKLNLSEIICSFREEEGMTFIIRKETADIYGIDYSFVASWITLKVHSSLSAVGLTAAFSNALSGEGISCNVIAAYYHDHIFVDSSDANKAMAILENLKRG